MRKTRGVEAAKRLAPVRDTIRHLFAFSGNRCAVPDCTHPLINPHGSFIGEVCHIEAAEPGGPRFNAAMTNEERRLAANLMLLCHRHHVETDDEEKYPVAAMQAMKERHEEQFEESVSAIAESALVDITKQLPVGQPQTLKRFSDVLGWQLSSDEREGTLDEMLLPLLERFRLLAPEARGVLLVVVERGHEHGGDLSCPLHEIEQVTRTDRASLEQHVATLERYGIGALEVASPQMANVMTRSLNGWPFWRDLHLPAASSNVSRVAVRTSPRLTFASATVRASSAARRDGPTAFLTPSATAPRSSAGCDAPGRRPITSARSTSCGCSGPSWTARTPAPPRRCARAWRRRSPSPA